MNTHKGNQAPLLSAPIPGDASRGTTLRAPSPTMESVKTLSDDVWKGVESLRRDRPERACKNALKE
jgi:hypothetical protein